MWILDHRSSPPLWRPRAADDPASATLAFTTRRGGVSSAPYDSLNLGRSTGDHPEAVAANRARVLACLGLAHLATAGQVHGARVRVARDPGLHPACDALVTTRPGLAVAVTGADCLPLLYVTRGAVAAAHAGWRGLAAGIVAETLAAICAAAGVSAAEVAVHLGPCIRSCCYPVGRDVAARFPDSAVRFVAGQPRLDLAGAARRSLDDAGAGAIHDLGACTACSAEGYFSHRRDAGLTGRQWAVAALTGGRPIPTGGDGGAGV